MVRHAAVIGAGIMGRLLAIELHQAGWKVTVYDQSSGDDNCSSVAAGLLSPISELDQADPEISQLGCESITLHWPRILSLFAEPVYFRTLGSMVVHHPHDSAEWEWFGRRMTGYEKLSAVAIRGLEPELDKFEQAYYFPQEAQIDSQAVMKQFLRYFDENNIEFRPHSFVSSIQPGEIILQDQLQRFDHVFDCRGLGARDSYNDLRSVRGDIIWLHAPDVHFKRPIRLIHPRFSLYIVPRPGNIFLIGSTEFETDDHHPITVRTTLELLTAAYYVHPGFAEASLLKTAMHHRPTLSDHKPRIDYQQGLTAVNGLYRHGYLIGPSLARSILCRLYT